MEGKDPCVPGGGGFRTPAVLFVFFFAKNHIFSVADFANSLFFGS